MSLIITFMFEPAKLQMNWASANGAMNARGDVTQDVPSLPTNVALDPVGRERRAAARDDLALRSARRPLTPGWPSHATDAEARRPSPAAYSSPDQRLHATLIDRQRVACRRPRRSSPRSTLGASVRPRLDDASTQDRVRSANAISPAGDRSAITRHGLRSSAAVPGRHARSTPARHALGPDSLDRGIACPLRYRSRYDIRATRDRRCAPTLAARDRRPPSRVPYGGQRLGSAAGAIGGFTAVPAMARRSYPRSRSRRGYLKRTTGLEPATFGLGSQRSTN